jgi:glyoxylase-like metal-dependent hydrolase (beta-lactamase superfamily II)
VLVVLLVSVLTQLWDENCFVLANDSSPEAVIIDPGAGAAEAVDRLVAERGLRPQAVLLTHGHIDHVADAALIADAYDIPVHIHPADRELLTNPGAGLDPVAAAAVIPFLGASTLPEPSRVIEIEGLAELELAGLTWSVLHAPGHRPGCVMYKVQTSQGLLAFTGDVLFAGGIGRTDLPGGSLADMIASLRLVVLGPEPGAGVPADPPNLPDETIVLPGHGPQTTMAVERRTNPYLQPRFLESRR